MVLCLEGGKTFILIESISSRLSGKSIFPLFTLFPY